MSRHGRHDDHSENTRENLFADPYSGGHPPSPGGREDPPRYDPPSRYEDDPYAATRNSGDPYDGDPYGGDPYGGDPYGDGVPVRAPHAGEPQPDERETAVLRFGPGAFDGPPPDARGYDPRDSAGRADQGSAGRADQGHAGRADQDYAERGYDHADDEYPGGYSYAARDDYRTDDYSDDDYREVDYREDHYRDEAPAEYETAGQRAEPVAVGDPHGATGRDAGARKRRKRGRVVGALAAAVLLIVVLGGGYLAYERFVGPGAPPDFTGPPGPEVVVQVHPGDTAGEIGSEFVDKGVVASSAAFYEAAVQNSGMNALQPGFYQIPTNIPAVDAVAKLVTPETRVGALVISEGRQLHDIRDVNTGAVRKGIYTLIAEASCHGDPGAENCVTYEELDAAGATPDLQALGVPAWAREAVANVPDRSRQLEGLIAAGSWDFDPTAEPVEILARLVSESASSYEATGITEAAARVGLTPYEMLISASLVEREALPQDFAKVARVILNRLDIGQMLQFDSTVNYELDETELATTDADRARVTPWNTYAKVGLPATPISSPSIGALQAMENPEPGEWIYFVTIDDKGTTLFANSYEEHLRNTELALQSGILDSGR
ncbi:endolytic transglycosylase MltG [Rhodococcus sp. CH91]|uniref:endolytic transglycosylase MltG n=1 Tax=Rhodococcus sp. CH91 TaxID=2910256 RepID=UPI001F4AAC35|nr:endolytic transglycosylase MltG [Rhodococcus sp. CH91]